MINILILEIYFNFIFLFFYFFYIINNNNLIIINNNNIHINMGNLQNKENINLANLRLVQK